MKTNKFVSRAPVYTHQRIYAEMMVAEASTYPAPNSIVNNLQPLSRRTSHASI